MTSDNSKSEAQLELFELDKLGNKSEESSRKEIALGTVIYQKDVKIPIKEFEKRLSKKIKEIINDTEDDLPF